MKQIFLFLLFIAIASIIWGENKLEPSGGVGVGVFFANDFGGGIENKINIDGTAITNRMPMNTFRGGIFAYGDFVYVEILCGFFYGGGTWEIQLSSPINQSQKIGDFSFLGVDFGLFGKYPFIISPKIGLFPLLGFDFQTVLFAKLDTINFDDNLTDWWQFWFKIGGGLDYKINKTLTLRFEVLYGMRPSSNVENDLANGTQAMANGIFQNSDGNTLIGHGLTIRIAVGI